MLRFLSDRDAYVITEQDFLPAVRSLATKLILSGKERNRFFIRRYRISLGSPLAGHLHTYETLSSDVQKNVLAALRRLAAVTKLRA